MKVWTPMARLSLLVLGLAALLGPGLALNLVNLNQMVEELQNRFSPRLQNGKVPIFSLAVRVPEGSPAGEYDVHKITDSSEDVRKTIRDECEVYVDQRLVAATVLLKKGAKHCKSVTPVFGHAESRVLQKFPWQEPEGSELMLFYTSSSPCDGTCTKTTSKHNILGRIKVISKWPVHALVFSDIFQPNNGPPIPENTLVQSLENLAASVGRNNIYRCSQGRCQRCFDNNDKVVRFCVSEGDLSDRSPIGRSSGGSVRRSRSEGEYVGNEQRRRKAASLQDRNRISRSLPTDRQRRRGSQSPRKQSPTRQQRNRSSRSPSPKRGRGNRSKSPVRRRSKKRSPRRIFGQEAALMFLY